MYFNNIFRHYALLFLKEQSMYGYAEIKVERKNYLRRFKPLSSLTWTTTTASYLATFTIATLYQQTTHKYARTAFLRYKLYYKLSCDFSLGFNYKEMQTLTWSTRHSEISYLSYTP